MSRKQELRRRIEALELSRSLIDAGIAEAKAALAEIEAAAELAWKEDPFVKQTKTKKLAGYFHGLGFLITACRTQIPSDPFYAIAKQAWNCRSDAVPFFAKLYKARDEEFDYPVPVTPSTAAPNTGLLTLCSKMHSAGLLSFSRESGTIHVIPSFPKQKRNFLNGGWAEEVNRYLVCKVLADYAGNHKLKYKIFWDVCLKAVDSDRTNDHDMQLDLVIQINDRFYVIETKSGALGIQKWVERAAIFNQNGNRFLTCSAGPEADPRLFQPYRLLSLEKIEQQLTEILDRDFPLPDRA